MKPPPVGLDFDTPIVRREEVFSRLSSEKKLPPSVPVAKARLRDYPRA